MKKLVHKYEFDVEHNRIYFPDEFLDKNPLKTESFLLITNLTTAEIIYQFNDPDKGGTFRYNYFTLEYDVSSMSPTDKLQIFVDVKEAVHIKDSEGRTMGELNSAFHVTQEDLYSTFRGIYKELVKMNLHLESMTDLNLTNRDIDGER
jgi:hypothetical protein